MSLQSPDPRDVRYLKLVFGRAQGATDAAVVTDLSDPDINSPQVLYRRLHNDNYPVCPICGEAPVRPGHCQERPVQRRPRSAGEARDLPPASTAMPLFRERIEALVEAVEGLPHLVERSQGGRFVGASVYHDPILFFREQFSEDQWRKVCEAQGEDPASDRVLATGLSTRNPVGASQAPPRPLTILIAAYALADGNMDELLRVLHPNPSEADADKLSRLLYAKKSEHGEDGLVRRAEQVATLVRGGKVGRGAPPPEISPREHNTACHITHRREHGWSWDQICEELIPKGFTRDDISRLSALELRWPD